MRLGHVAALGLSFALVTLPALGDEKEACIAASEGADRLDDAGKLIEVRDRLAFCSRDACPKVVRDECTRRLDALEKRIPTFVVRATDGEGADIVDAKVFIDDKVVAEQIDGKPIKLDPGPHTIRVTPLQGGTKTQQVVAAEGDHLRAVTLSFGSPAAPPPKTDTEPKGTPGRPVQGWIGAGMIGTGVLLTVFGLVLVPSALDNYSQYKAEGVGLADCPESNPLGTGLPKCHVRDTAGKTFNERGNAQLVPAIVLLSVGTVLAVVGTVLLTTSFGRAASKAQLVPAFGPGYGGLGLSGTF